MSRVALSELFPNALILLNYGSCNKHGEIYNIVNIEIYRCWIIVLGNQAIIGVPRHLLWRLASFYGNIYYVEWGNLDGI